MFFVLCCRWGEKHAKLSAALGRLLDDYSLVKFFPLDITNEENVVDLLTVVSIFIKGYVDYLFRVIKDTLGYIL